MFSVGFTVVVSVCKCIFVSTGYHILSAVSKTFKLSQMRRRSESQPFTTEEDSFPSESSRFVASLRWEPSRRNLHSCSEEQQARAETQEGKTQRVSSKVSPSKLQADSSRAPAHKAACWERSFTGEVGMLKIPGAGMCLLVLWGTTVGLAD